MATATTPLELRRAGPPSGTGANGGGDGGDGKGRPRLPRGTQRLGMWLALASISMLFLGLTSAYVVGQASDTVRGIASLPPLLLVNTFVLLASSVALELARKAGRSGPAGARTFGIWLVAAFALGAAFVAGQLIVWRQLSQSGVYLGTSPHSSFFYTLTGLHGLHLLGGIAALGRLALRPQRDLAAAARWLDVTSLYWHFMGGLWLYLLVLLFGLR